MSILGFFILLLVAAICGSIGSGLAGYTSRGCLTNTIIGLIGALIGTWLSRELKVGDFLVLKNIPIFWSIIGSALFVAIIGGLAGKHLLKKK